MTDEEAQKVLDELLGVKPEVLTGEAKRLFEAIMKIADERDLAKESLKNMCNIADERNQLLVENQKKDKMIDLMAKMIVENHEWFYSEFDNFSVKDFIKYFEKKVEKGD